MMSVEMTDLNASNTNGLPALDANGPNLWHTEARAGCHPRGLAVAGDGLLQVVLVRPVGAILTCGQYSIGYIICKPTLQGDLV
jgi:hypothetical protein